MREHHPKNPTTKGTKMTTDNETVTRRGYRKLSFPEMNSTPSKKLAHNQLLPLRSPFEEIVIVTRIGISRDVIEVDLISGGNVETIYIHEKIFGATGRGARTFRAIERWARDCEVAHELRDWDNSVISRMEWDDSPLRQTRIRSRKIGAARLQAARPSDAERKAIITITAKIIAALA